MDGKYSFFGLRFYILHAYGDEFWEFINGFLFFPIFLEKVFLLFIYFRIKKRLQLILRGSRNCEFGGLGSGSYRFRCFSDSPSIF